VICHEQCLGQITNKFSTRWSSQRSSLDKLDCKDDNDQMALSRPHAVTHSIVNKPTLQEACTVAFVEKKVYNVRIPVRINSVANLTQNLIFKA